MGLMVLCFAEAGSRSRSPAGRTPTWRPRSAPSSASSAGCCSGLDSRRPSRRSRAFFADAVAALVPAHSFDTGGARRCSSFSPRSPALNVRGVRGAQRFNAAMTVAKLLPLALARRRWRCSPCAREPRLAVRTGGGRRVVAASVILIFAFLGVESGARAERRGARIRRARCRARCSSRWASSRCCTSRVQVVAQGVLGAALARRQTPLADAARCALGPWGRTLILVGSTVSHVRLRERDDARRAAHAVRVRARRLPAAALAACTHAFTRRTVAIAIQTRRCRRARGDRHASSTGDHRQRPALLVYFACCVATVGAAAARRARRRRAVPRAGGAIVPWLALAVIVWILLRDAPGMSGSALRRRARASAIPVVRIPRCAARRDRRRRRRRTDDAIRCSRSATSFRSSSARRTSSRNSLGAMPRAVPERLAEYADDWAELGVRAWAERMVGDAGRGGRRDRAAHRRGAGRGGDGAQRVVRRRRRSCRRSTTRRRATRS